MPNWFKIAAVVLAISTGTLIAAFLADVSYQLSEHRDETNKSNRYHAEANNDQHHKPEITALHELITGGYYKRYAAYCEQHSDPNATDWIWSFWCGVKVTDAASVAGTLATVLLTLGLLLIAVAQCAVYFKQAKIMERQLKAATEATNVAERTLIAAQRAWVKIDLTVGANIRFDQRGMMTISLRAEVHNTGESPATDVAVQSLSFLGDDGQIRPRVIYDWFREQIIDRSATGGLAGGLTLFPGQSEKVSIEERIGPQTISDYVRKFTDQNGRPYNFLNPYVVGLAVYRIPLDQKVHHTGFAVSVRPERR